MSAEIVTPTTDAPPEAPPAEHAYSAEPAEQDHSPEAHAAPRGAAAFAFLMLLGYTIYLTSLWLEVVGRGS